MTKKSLLIALICIITFGYTSAQDKATVERLKQHVYILAADSMEGRGFGSKSMEKSVQYIIGEMKSAGLQPLGNDYRHSFSFKQGTLQIEGNNLVAVIDGTDENLKNEYIVLGAHYDHLGWEMEDNNKIIYNGADDNASGMAALLEIGKYLQAHRNQLKRSVILVAFDGEESGLIGSGNFISQKVVDPSRIKIMFSLDMVGMYSKNKGIELLGIGSMEDGSTIAGQVNKEKGLSIIKKTKNIVMRTDTRDFGHIGIPAVHVFTGTKSPYHKPEDDSNLLDYEGMAKICDYIETLVQNLSIRDTIQPIHKLQIVKDKKRQSAFNWGARLNLGSNYHQYKDGFYQGKKLFAFDAGLFTQIKLNRHLVLQPEICYENKGGKHELGYLHMQSVSMPVNLLLVSSTQEYNPRVFLLLGGYYSYHFAGKAGGKSIDFDEMFRRDEAGVNYGVGFQFMKIQLGLYGKSGLSNLMQHSADGKLYNRSGYLSLGYCF